MIKNAIETVAAFEIKRATVDTLTESEKAERDAKISAYREATRAIENAKTATVEAFKQSGKPSEAWKLLVSVLGFDDARETVAMLVAMATNDGRISGNNRTFARDVLGRDLFDIAEDLRRKYICYPDAIHPANFNMIADAARTAERPQEAEKATESNEETAHAEEPTPEEIIVRARYAAKSPAAQKTVDELINRRTEALNAANAWRVAKVNKTKSGTEFAQLGRACEGCAIGKYYPVEDAGRPWLTVSYRGPLGRWQEEHIAIYSDDMTRTDYRETVERYGTKYGTFNADAANAAIIARINALEASAAEYLDEIRKAPEAIAEAEKAAEEVARVLREIGGKFNGSSRYPSSLQYLARDIVKDAINRADLVRG